MLYAVFKDHMKMVGTGMPANAMLPALHLLPEIVISQLFRLDHADWCFLSVAAYCLMRLTGIWTIICSN